MELLTAFIATISSIVAYSLLVAGVYKLFMISNDLTEIKKLLRDRTKEVEASSIHAALKE